MSKPKEKAPLTREQFEGGVPFRITTFQWGSEIVYQFDAPEEDDYGDGCIVSLDPYRHIANVEKIDEAGFTFYTYILGKHIVRKTWFSECIASQFRGKKNEKETKP